MAFRHGVYKSEVPTSLISPVRTEAGLPVIVGTAPVHLGSDDESLTNVNKPQLIYSYNDAVKLFGYSDNWEKYTLCKFIYSQFVLFAVSPCVLINVLDPAKHKETVSPANFTISDGEANLGQDVILSAGITFESGTNYIAGVDYSIGYDDSGNAILSVIKGGKLASASTVKAG
ncbi:MAG: phage tail sheath family protein, partial [Synergistaceae bacterium]|nr:phage tail sheath family protein [Synergistaceae bacterium]